MSKPTKTVCLNHALLSLRAACVRVSICDNDALISYNTDLADEIREAQWKLPNFKGKTPDQVLQMVDDELGNLAKAIEESYRR